MNNLKFYGGKTNGDIVGVFKDKEYSDLPVKDRVVLDIGANIADSAIYFAAQGAKHVLAIEPDERCHKFAQKNVEVNGFSEVVNIIRGAVVSSNSNINENSSMKLLTLQDIIRNYDLESTILKMDCEGCEYDVILNTPPDVLRNFTHVKLEYHYGYRNVMNKLRNSGFLTKATRPRYFKPALNPNSLNVYFAEGRWERINSVYVGWLVAIRQ